MSNGNGKLRISRPIIDGILIVLLLLSIGVSGFLANQATQESQLAATNAKKAQEGVEQAKAIANETDAKITKFIGDWWERVRVGNVNTNTTQGKITHGVDIIIGNLTEHRHIQNVTRDEDEKRQNETLSSVKALQNQTNNLISKFNQTNEIERAKAVNSILDGISNNTEAINLVIDYLNITTVTEEPENTQVQTDLEDLLQQYLSQQNTNSTPTK